MSQPKKNYQKIMEQQISEIPQGTLPRLLLHCCCAPCSSAVLEYLNRFFSVTVLYYNPNISPKEEYEYRKAELRRLIREYPWENPVSELDCDWESESFRRIADGLEQEREGGARCEKCFSLRLSKTAELAKDGGFDYFTTTLTISPLKNAGLLNELGGRLADRYGVSYLFSDFKKKDGYKRSIELSAEYGLYRQDYCGCIYSKQEREQRKAGSE